MTAGRGNGAPAAVDAVCGVLVRTWPETAEGVAARLVALDGVEVHSIEPDGRLIVTVEGDDGDAVGERVLELHRTAGVLSALLVYQHTEIAEDA